MLAEVESLVERTVVQNSGSLQFFTIVAQNYMAYALVLGKSVLRYHPDATFSVFILDDPDRRWRDSLSERGFQTIYPDNLPLTEYRKFVFQYNLTEASTGVKPFVFQFLFDHGADQVIYLDPDILCFRRFDEVFAALERYRIVLTPHICAPNPENYFPGEKGILSGGVFNLGFLALRKSESSTAFIKWWSEHLRYECLSEIDSGLFVDQKWVDLVPSCFEDVFILRNTTYNIAYWNLHERSLETREGTLYEVQSSAPVTFIHFSGIAVDDLNSIAKYAARNPFNVELHKKRFTLAERLDLAPSFRRYRELLLSEGIETCSKMPYAYATYENGERISQMERSLYLTSWVWQQSSADPFAVGPGSFWNACRKAGIKACGPVPAKLSATETSRRYGLGMRTIEGLLRLCLRTLGPERYLHFAKYMRHQFLPFNHGFLLRMSPPDLSKSQPEPLGVSKTFWVMKLGKGR
jgi:hypothetical protein